MLNITIYYDIFRMILFIKLRKGMVGKDIRCENGTRP